MVVVKHRSKARAMFPVGIVTVETPWYDGGQLTRELDAVADCWKLYPSYLFE